MTLAQEKKMNGANELRKAFSEIWDSHMTDYEMKETELFIRVANGFFLPFEKPSMKTDFCFGYNTDFSGHECSDAQRRRENFLKSASAFKTRNLEEIDGELEELKNEDNKVFIYCKYMNGGKIAAYQVCNMWSTSPRLCDNTEYWEASTEERKSIVASLTQIRASFEKRIDSYLKKYGTSKLRTWTYWIDE